MQDALGISHKLQNIICVDVNTPTEEQICEWKLLPEDTGNIDVKFSAVDVSDKHLVQELFEYAKGNTDALSVFHLSSIVSGPCLLVCVPPLIFRAQ